MAGVELISLDDAARKNSGARLAAMRAADLVVLCLPDDAAREAAAMAQSLGEAAPKILDASTAHRVAPGWVYGFPEMCATQSAAIAKARLVANPGCYATGAIALLRPLIDAGVIPPDFDISINAISGYSGGGKAMIAAHEAQNGPAFELYALGLAHKHVPEIMSVAGLTRRPIFMPSVGHFVSGMLVCIPLFLDRLPGRPTADEIAGIFAERYQGRRHVRVVPGLATGELDPQTVQNTDDLEILLCANPHQHHAVLVARLDNLGKGASGAAVQNIALMLGLADPLAPQKEFAHA
jgi:N-acetyl-gamma-glutamyl-phosphate reductase